MIYNGHMPKNPLTQQTWSTTETQYYEMTGTAQELATTIDVYASADERRYSEGLALIGRVEADLRVIRENLVRDARANRFTWDQIGKWLLISRQGAFNKFSTSSE